MHEVFIPNNNYDKEGYDVLTMTGRSPTAGEIGIEIECEGNKFPKASAEIPPPWKYTHDGSLRGQDNAEYVLQKPIKFSEVEKAVNTLYKTLENYGTVLDDSNRTSVHVHLNVQTFHLPRLTTFLGLYFAVEEVLTEWCGDHRVGNLFCLRSKDAPAIVSKIKSWIVNDGRSGSLTEGLHYSGMNAQALIKFGSLEIRSLRGVTDPALVVKWVAVLERLYNLSGEYADPRLVTEDFSGNDPLNFLKNILGEHYDTVRSDVSMTDEQVRASMYDGIRMAQDLCYCRDWSRYKPADPAKNPFGRNRRTPPGGISFMDYAATGMIPMQSLQAAQYQASQTMAIWDTIATAPPPLSTPPEENPESDVANFFEEYHEEYDPDSDY